MKKSVGVSTAYTEHYKSVLMAFWYSSGRPDSVRGFAETVPDDEFGRKPDYHTIAKWRDEYLWDAWADELDAKAESVIEDVLVNQRVLMLKRQASNGKEMQDKAMNHFRTREPDTTASAVSMMKLGVDMERTSRGISDRIVKMTKMSDEELTTETQKLLDDAFESGEIIDMADIPEDKNEEEDVEDAEI